MKFGDKYELLESLTTGAVETFVANDKVRGERVLVHILDCAPQKPNQSTMEWVLESFRRVAPEPAGPVLESGKYSGTQYAYLVTKPADEAALKTWVRRYEIQALDTQESAAARSKPVQKSVPAIEPPAVPLPPPLKEPMPAAVSVTQLLRDFDSQSQSPAGSAEPIASPQPLPNFSIGRDSGLHSAPPWEPVHAPVPNPPQKDEPLIRPPMEPLSSSYKDKGFVSGSFPAGGPPSSATPTIKEGKAGEFTSFFQGPFRGEASSDMPASVSSQPIEAAPPKKVGDFTAVFGSVGGRPEQASSSLEESGNNPPAGSFTGMFKDMELPPPTFNTTTPLPPPPSALKQKPIEPFASSAGANEVIPPPVFVAPPPPPIVPQPPPMVPIPPVPSVASEKPRVAKPSALPGDGATGAFTNPGAREPAPVFQEAPAGPSPYTQIISRDKLMAGSAEGEEEEEEAPGFPSAGKFGAPPKAPAIKPPKMAPMKMPPAPPKPKIAAPAAPKAPKMPKVEAPAQPPVTPWPVIITLIVLFFLAVLLVMYFWLKSH